MRIDVVAFSTNGCATAKRVWEALADEDVRLFSKTSSDSLGLEPVQGPVREWVGKSFSECDAIVFVGATGIAVRYIAPYVRSKDSDPAVVCIDEHGRWAIALLSGHIGGCNRLTERIADGMPCIAECGGFMYLHDRMEGSDGEMHAMCGVIPGEVRNTGKLTRFGYAEFSPLKENGVTRGWISVKGHEFHYWDSDNCGSDWRAVKANGMEYDCMHDTGRMLAGYPHLYYYSNPEFATRFLERCLEYRNG